MPQPVAKQVPPQAHSSAEDRLSEIRAMQRRLSDLEKETLAEIGREAAPAASASATVEDWVDLEIAAKRFGVCSDTMLNSYVKKHKIGRKVVGRWKVDMVRARAWREGRYYDPL